MRRPHVPTMLATALVLALGLLLGTWLEGRGDEAARPDDDEARRADLEAAPPTAAQPPLMGRAPAIDTGLEDVQARLAALEEAMAALREEARQLAAAREALEALAQRLQAPPVEVAAARRQANESAAVATLRNSISAQAQMQASARIDTDGDGTGEYGGFLELSGALAGRMDRPLFPPVLSSAFRHADEHGVVPRAGYRYRIHLPDPGGRGVPEPGDGYRDDGTIDADLAEVTWCLYAWPSSPEAGQRTFFTNQMGDTLATRDARYVGSAEGPAAEAAFLERGITGPVAVGQRGRDGNVWQHVR